MIVNREEALRDKLVDVLDSVRSVLTEHDNSGMPWWSAMDELAETFEELGLPHDGMDLETISRNEIIVAVDDFIK